MIKHSIVLGALNEEKRLPKTLKSLLVFLKKNKLWETTEVVVVAADGNDNTKGVAKSHLSHFKYSQLITPGAIVGKGRDIRLGILESKGEIRAYMDADMATPLTHLLDMFEILDNGDSDIVIGTRDIRKMHGSSTRRLISVFGNIAFGLISGFYLPDTQCGFKGFSERSAKVCFGKLTRLRWSFDMEILLIAKIHNFSVAQLPIKDWKDVDGGTFNSNWRQTLIFGKDLARLFINRLSGRYKQS